MSAATSMSPEPAGSFALNRKLPGLGPGAAIRLTPATDADVYTALLQNQPFPSRPIALGRITLEAAGDCRLSLGEGAVTFSASGTGRLGLAVLDDAPSVATVLGLRDAGDLELALDGAPGERFAVFVWAYDVEGKAGLTHPLGAIGSGSFGVSGRHASVHAVVRRFPASAGARDSIAGLFDSWQLPRHVASATDLLPGTSIVSEVQGSLAVQVTAQLGYDFSFVREVRAGTLQGDLGLRLDARIRATVGLEASGRYLVQVSRPSLDEQDAHVRVRLTKLATKGWRFGLDLAATVKPETAVLPESADDLVAAVFGVHGQQVLKDLRALEQWTDPARDPAELVAGLARDSAFDLLRRVTGIDPATAFERAQRLVTDTLRRWDELPHRFASALWTLLERSSLDAELAARLRTGLAALTGDEAAARQTLRQAMSSVSFVDSPLGRLLVAAADRGLLELLDRTDTVRHLAARALELLDGGHVARLQQVIAQRLRLDTVRRVATRADFEALDAWLVARLSAFLDERLDFDRLQDVRLAIDSVLEARHDIYDRARDALARTYDARLAAGYERATARTALLDVTFDTDRPEARERLHEVLAGGRCDRVLIEDCPGVTLDRGVLTHEISRAGSVEISLPFYDTRTGTLTSSLARVRASAEGGRVLFYELDARDVASRRGRLKSDLAVGGTLAFDRETGVRRFAPHDARWSYRYLYARENVRREELEALLAPIVHEYFADRFGPGESSFGTWLTDFDRRVEDVLGNATNDFGDVLLSLEISAPSRSLAAWLEARDAAETRAASMAVSLRLQRVLKRLLPHSYFASIDRLDDDPRAAALLVYGAIPPSTSVRLARGRLTEGTAEHVYWDWRDAALRDRMTGHPSAAARLRTALADAQRRLLAAGRRGPAAWLDPSRPERILDATRRGFGEFCLTRLLLVEAEIVESAAAALADAAAFRRDAQARPSAAIERLARFGEHVTGTFNRELEAFFGSEGLRPLGTAMFLEASCALDPALDASGPAALLALTVLREARSFDLRTFAEGAVPDRRDVAVAQRLVTGAA